MTWDQRIERAVKAKKFEAQDRADALVWRTCPCAEYDQRLYDSQIGFPKPMDAELVELGCAFYACVRDDQPEKAAMTLERIRMRAKELGIE